jgi:hypothetical protein
MAGSGHTESEIFDGMNRLINAGKIEVPEDGHYCHVGVYEKQKEAEGREAARRQFSMNVSEMKRSSFDLLPPAERRDFCKRGGRVID